MHLKMLSLKISKILKGFEMSLANFTRNGSTSFEAPSSPVTASYPPHQGQPADYSCISFLQKEKAYSLAFLTLI